MEEFECNEEEMRLANLSAFYNDIDRVYPVYNIYRMAIEKEW